VGTHTECCNAAILISSREDAYIYAGMAEEDTYAHTGTIFHGRLVPCSDPPRLLEPVPGVSTTVAPKATARVIGDCDGAGGGGEIIKRPLPSREANAGASEGLADRFPANFNHPSTTEWRSNNLNHCTPSNSR
jgi:hypothetical protein